MNKKIVYAIIMIFPIIINYGLLSWRAPGVVGDTSAWLGFLGSYLGFIGAVSIALFQNRKQKERDNQQDLENKRSYVVVNDMIAHLKLKKIKTHENSRIIETPAYLDILDEVGSNYGDYTTTYLNISQYGNSPVIMNCKIDVEYSGNDNIQKKLEANIGVLEQGVEVFIPIVPTGAQLGELVEINTIKVNYLTLSGEKMKWEIRHLEDIEYYAYFNKDGKETELFRTPINNATWTYPNKLKEQV
ncbi:hypothetical protein [Lysinibacillus sp. RC79]|uniref:hypothetical protein n=1 Tax=Lysinibacillus sp. RC79 TaxID=3156296 RepID=UPI0035129CEA